MDPKAVAPYAAAVAAFAVVEFQALTVLPDQMKAQEKRLELQIAAVESGLVASLVEKASSNSDQLEEHDDTLHWLLRWVTGWEAQYPEHAARLRLLLGEMP